MTALASVLVMNVSTACGCFFSAAFNSVPQAMAYLVPFDYILMITSGVFVQLRYENILIREVAKVFSHFFLPLFPFRYIIIIIIILITFFTLNIFITLCRAARFLIIYRGCRIFPGSCMQMRR